LVVCFLICVIFGCMRADFIFGCLAVNVSHK
jgi:hypothetical protein